MSTPTPERKLLGLDGIAARFSGPSVSTAAGPACLELLARVGFLLAATSNHTLLFIARGAT
jgi:hypothetical protein